MLTTQELANLLRVNADTIRRWQREGTFGPKAVRTPSKLLYRRSDVIAWLEENEVPAEDVLSDDALGEQLDESIGTATSK